MYGSQMLFARLLIFISVFLFSSPYIFEDLELKPIRYDYDDIFTLQPFNLSVDVHSILNSYT